MSYKYKGHIMVQNDIKKTDSIKKIQSIERTEVIDIVQKNKDLNFIYKKIERIVSATFIITNLFPEDELLRTKLRDKSVYVLSVTSSVKDKINDSYNFSRIESCLLEILSLLKIGYMIGLVSEMNYTIFQKEVTIFIKNIHQLNDGPLFSSTELLHVPESFFAVSERKQESPLSESPLNKKNFVPEHPLVFGGKESHLKTLRSIAEKESSPKKQESSPIVRKRNTRREMILNLLKNKDKIKVSDISKVLDSVSTKTIQRELSALIKEGVLLKEGRRRWSTYSLR